MNYPELNEKNVMLILKRVLSDKNNPNRSVIPPVIKQLEGREMFCDGNLLNSEIPNINSMFGQTQIIHNRDKLFDFQKGKFMYDGKKWTDSDKQLVYFYSLLVASSTIDIPQYNKHEVSFFSVLNRHLPALKRPDEIGNGERNII